MRRKNSAPRGWSKFSLPDTTPGERIRKCRVEKGLTQIQLAGLVDAAPTTLSKMERGDTDITVEEAKELADALETSLEYLMNGDTPPVKNEGGGQAALKDGQTVFVAVTQDGGNISVAVFASSESAIKWVESEQKDHGRCRVFAETVY